MGNTNQGENTLETYAPNFNEWKRKEIINIWYHVRKPDTEIEQYHIKVKSRKSIEVFSKIYKLRNYHEILVASFYYTLFQDKNYLKEESISLFLQRIPLRLNQIGPIKFPQVLHLYYHVFSGYRILTKYMNCFFKVNKRMIGVNTKGVVKVWLNQNFDMISVHSIGYNEAKMISQILTLLYEHTQLGIFSRDMYRKLSQDKCFQGIISSIERLANKKQICSGLSNNWMQLKAINKKNQQSFNLSIRNSSNFGKNPQIINKNRTKHCRIKSNQSKKPSITQKQAFKDCKIDNNTSREADTSFGINKKYYQNPNQTVALPDNMSANSTLTAQLPNIEKSKRNSSPVNFFKPLRMVNSIMQQSSSQNNEPNDNEVKDQKVLLQEFGLQNIVQNYRKSVKGKQVKKKSIRSTINSSLDQNKQNISNRTFIKKQQKRPSHYEKCRGQDSLNTQNTFYNIQNRIASDQKQKTIQANFFKRPQILNSNFISCANHYYGSQNIKMPLTAKAEKVNTSNISKKSQILATQNKNLQYGSGIQKVRFREN